MHRTARWGAVGATLVTVGASLVIAGGGSAGASPNPLLARNAHGHMANGKALPHASGGAEVTFDDERAMGADASVAPDSPPDGTASALGCANRGSSTNVRVNQDCTARRQAEEQVAVNPTDPTNVIAGQNDSRIGFNHCGFDYSFNSGQTWGDGLPGFFQHLSPIGHTYDAASDPAVTFSQGGVAWFSCVVFDVNSPASGLIVVPSTAGLKGAAYANVGAGASKWVVAETADNKTFFDKEFIAGDPNSGAVYVTFTKFISDQKCSTGNNPGAYCSSEIFFSKWNGTSWSTPANVSGASSLCVGGNTFDRKAAANACNFDQGSYPVVEPNGDLFVAWNNGNTPTLVNQTLGRTIHPDGSMGPVVKVGKDDESNLALCDFGRGPEECVAQINVRTNDFPAVAVDPTNANHLVATWQDTRLSSTNSKGQYDVVVSDSTDGGATWSDATTAGGTVLPAPANGALFEPAVAVTGAGRTAVTYYRANAYTATDGMGTYGYGLQDRPAAATAFAAYTPLSDSQTLASPQGNPVQAGFLGDYSSVAAPTTGDAIHAVWADTRNGLDQDVFVANHSF